MDSSARIGQFSVATGSYGAPITTVKPPDNSVTPAAQTPADIAAAAAQAQLDAIYNSLKTTAGTV
jgi:hypothetical protein